MELGVKDRKKNANSVTGTRGPEKPDVSDLPLVHSHDHVHTIDDIKYITTASAFGEDHESPDLVTKTQGGVPNVSGKPSAKGKTPRSKVA